MYSCRAYNPTTMRRTRAISLTVATAMFVLLFGRSMFVAADTASAPSLAVSQFKITSTNGQFITLYNSTDSTLDMSKYQLEYFNHYDLTKATSSRLISLSGTLPPHGYYMVNDSSLLLCYQLNIEPQSLGLYRYAGMIQVMSHSQPSPGAGVVQVLQDYVGWSKISTSGAVTLPSNANAFMQRQPQDNRNNPSVITPGGGSWLTVQHDSANPCKLITATTSPTQVASGFSLLLPSTEPPAAIVNIAGEDSGSTLPSLPTSDIGLMAPQITELLPNPSGTGNDTTDEFIELYNPNPVGFDLTGFILQTGLTSVRKYTFPAGTILPPKSFKAYLSEETGLSLSNTASQVKLLDPFGNSISATAQYVSAKDGQAWALAKRKWYWSTSATPNSLNVVKQPVATKKSKSTSKPKTTKSGSKNDTKTSSSQNSSYSDDEPSTNPVHAWTLALIAGLAILYGLYEYRSDLGSRINQLRKNFRNRRFSRAETERR